jgi:hypothetical protein
MGVFSWSLLATARGGTTIASFWVIRMKQKFYSQVNMERIFFFWRGAALG